MKILICEDEEILLTALEFRMRKKGFDVELAKDGQEAWEKIQAGGIDFVIADLVTPKVSGLDLVKKIRKKYKRTLPIIVISSMDYDEDIHEAMKLGANDFVIKPFKPAELVLRVNIILHS